VLASKEEGEMSAQCYRVLALDGGGIRGLIAGTVLEEIETKMQRPIADMFDLVAGTSTGGILALGLVKPAAGGKPEFTAKDMCDLYLNEGTTIFHHSLFQDVKTLHGVTDARYPSEPIERILGQHFGNTMLSEALKDVVIPSYDLCAPAPYFFKREYAQDPQHNWDVDMARVARATSAAPTYFDPAILPSDDGGPDHALVDGGTFANNPTLSAYVDALRLKGNIPRVLVVSIGTGRPPQTPGSGPIPINASHVRDFGLMKWARPILEVVLDGVPKAVEYQMGVMQAAIPAALTYYRLQSDLPTASHALDDASAENTERLVADAKALIAEKESTLQDIYRELA
jgi:predicted acylesterase/phospholipase RssA